MNRVTLPLVIYGWQCWVDNFGSFGQRNPTNVPIHSFKLWLSPAFLYHRGCFVKYTRERKIMGKISDPTMNISELRTAQYYFSLLNVVGHN